MITDRIPLAGLDSYFRDPATRDVNLAVSAPAVRTEPLGRGRQLEVSGIHLLIEHEDLRPLMRFQFDGQSPPRPAPLFKISVVKEMFPGLFADPYGHRVHNVAGFLDFNDGTLANGRVLEVDGIPTIVSVGRGDCTWVSREYVMPEPISVAAVAWELATSKLAPPDSFHYAITIECRGEGGAALPPIAVGNAGQMLKAAAPRAAAGLDGASIKSFRVSFTARVYEDSYLTERHGPVLGENLGRPLLRAVNILEPVKSVFEVHSLAELQNLCSEFRLLDTHGPEITGLTATLDLSAVLVNSANQFIQPDNVPSNPAYDIYDAASVYEFIELKPRADTFRTFEARRIGFDSTKQVL